MNTKAQLKKFERSMDDLRSITRAFEHTATKRMAVNKSEIEKIGKHLSEVKQTYVNTKISIAKGGKQPFDFVYAEGNRSTQGKQAAVLNLNVRKVSKAKIVLLITSEPAYYGNLMPKMISEFVSELGDGTADAVIIGKPGRVEFDKINRGRFKYKFFDFSDEAPDWQIVSQISEVIKTYGQINIIFCKFESILTQDVLNQNIAQEALKENTYEKKKYLIKPEPVSALTFLEKQILSSNLLQKLFENGLAKGAIRVRILEIGEIAERLSESMEKFEIYKKKVIRDINNRKLVSLYSGSNIWHRESIFTVYR